jgi:hypothetical protein
VIHTVHQRRKITIADRLADVGRQVANREADPAPRGWIGFAAMNQPHVVQRHLARLQHKIDGRGPVRIDCDLLAAAQQIIGREGVAMPHLLAFVRSRNHPHGAILERAFRNRDPGGDDIGRL